MLTRKYLIFGIVQGVGYRAFAQSVAQSLKLSGYVRNLPDGSVECVAQGSEEVLSRFYERLREGPPLARVSEIQVKDIAGEDLPFPFAIKR
ncbi:MAG: acylphosphatase [Leptospiraceae bacterium]|nr:acylphosphatase [Leptospiraceae bacterium]MDW8307404.1 acylphosphatase [Leptospiraceae bacterium]